MSEPSQNRVLFLFPGQGSQYPGIGSDLHLNYSIVRDIYDTASTELGYDLVGLSNDFQEQKIHLTRYTQPALLTHSIACLRVFQELSCHRVTPAFACGHSLGEYSALVAAQSLGFESAVRLVSKRGQLMSEYGAGEMLALPVTVENLSSLLRKHYCALAACNLPEQSVAGGLGEDLDRLEADFQQDFPDKRAIRLKTEGAFHTHYMVAAALAYREVLAQASFGQPHCPVPSNYTGTFHRPDESDIRANLFFQLFNPVLWHANLMQVAEQGIDAIIEFGGGLGDGADPAQKRPNLAGMIMRAYRRVTPRPAYYSVINAKTLEDTLERIDTGK